MQQQQVESIALLLRTKSNTCSKIPPYQHTLPIINTCLSSHRASDQHHLGFDTLSAGLTVHISYPSISLHPLPSPRAKPCERYRSDCPQFTQITMLSTFLLRSFVLRHRRDILTFLDILTVYTMKTIYFLNHLDW